MRQIGFLKGNQNTHAYSDGGRDAMNQGKRLGRQIRALRQNRAWTQAELGRRCGVAKPQISKVENDATHASMRLCLKIGDVFERTIELIDVQPPRYDKLWVDETRGQAYDRICRLIRMHGAEKVDLLQFSGAVAQPILRVIDECCQNTKIRLLIASKISADSYDEREFHWNRIKNTLSWIQLIKETSPNISTQVWGYDIPPSISGVIIDDWLVSVGWYHALPSPHIPGRISMRGHEAPAITHVDIDDSNPLLSMVRKQIDAILQTANPYTID